MISTKETHQVQIFRLSPAPVKVHQIPHLIFQTKSQFLFKVWISFQCHGREFFCTFSAEPLYAIDKSSTSKCKFSDFPLLRLKFTKFFMSFFESRLSFFFKLWITLQCYETWLFCTFSSKSLYALDKKSQSKCKFLDFQLLAWKLSKFLKLFFNPQDSFPLDFASPFSVMTNNSSEIFWLKH